MQTLICCARVGFDQLGAIAALGVFELIAELVVAEGLGELTAVLERLAERESTSGSDRRGAVAGCVKRRAHAASIRRP